MARIFGQFELLENIGSGFLAELFKARAIHEPDQPPLVLKRIRPEFRYDTNLMARFVEGAQMVVGLEHPNIAAVQDAGVQQGRYYAALQYVAGKDLRKIVAKFETTRRALPIPVAMYLMTGVCRGLAFLHAARGADGEALNLVHADVSPQNVMVSFGGAVKLINVEGAWFRQKGWAPQRGKVAYMSPEQAAGEDVDTRSDVFSAGIMFWEILTGKRLFEGEDDHEVRQAVAEAPIIPPADANRMIPDELSEIVLRALSRHPDARYPTMVEMHDALTGFAEKSRLSFSSKQIASWMRMTFPDEAAKAPPEPSPSEEVQKVTAMAKGAGRPKMAGDSVPGLSQEDIPSVFDDATEEDESFDDATCIDPTSQMLAALEREGEEADSAVDPEQFSRPTPPRGVPAVTEDKSKRPTRESAVAAKLKPAAEPSPAAAPPPIAAVGTDAGARRIDAAMRDRRETEHKARTGELQALGPAGGADDAPYVPPGRPGIVDERDARNLDQAMRDRRHVGRRITGETEGRTLLRFERATPPSRRAPPPTPDERKSMIAILLIVGSLLAVGLAVLAWLMLAADATEDPLVRAAPAAHVVADAGSDAAAARPAPPRWAAPAPRWHG